MALSLGKILSVTLLFVGALQSSTAIETALPPPQDVTAYASTLKVPRATDLSEEGAKKYLKELDVQKGKANNAASLAEWAYSSNITQANLDQKLAVLDVISKFQKESWLETIKFPWRTFQDEDVKRQFSKLSILGAAALPLESVKRVEELVANMQTIYSTAKICDYNNKTKCDLALEPDLTKIMATSRNPEELKHVWVEFRKQAGDKCRQQFTEYVNISNQASRLNNQSDTAESWLYDYEAEDFRDQIQRLWEQLRPLYLQLHAYVRSRLRTKYGDEVVSKNGPIPAHLLGNMWAQNWGNIFDVVTPFPEKKALDVTPTMIAQGYTPERLFKMSEEFFTSLNLSAMPPTFWERSILRKPEGRQLICHASAYDFYDGKDFRIKQCTTVSMEQLSVAHHEMGHVEYFIQYKEQPNVYREGANPGFHEAVGDVMALSVSTRKHLREVGLLEAGEDDPSDELNHLFNLGLDKLSFLPFAYLMDLWRWNVFKGQITEADYNCEWWKRRLEYQGIQPPVNRSEDNFDPGSKYHIIASVPYIRYFVSYVIQFQFHRALCERAGQFDPANPERLPLHQCDIYRSTEAGNLLKSMLSLGSSKKWPEAMEKITGQRNMDASALLQYFAPLKRWLEQENIKNGETAGWNEPPKYVCNKERTSPPPSPSPTG